MSIEDAGHGISIGCIDACHLQKMPHMVSVSAAWVYGHHGHGYRVPPEQDATHFMINHKIEKGV
jgi:hypothetical protein